MDIGKRIEEFGRIAGGIALGFSLFSKTTTENDNVESISTINLDDYENNEKYDSISKKANTVAEDSSSYDMSSLRRGSMIVSFLELDRLKQKNIVKLERDMLDVAKTIGLNEVICSKKFDVDGVILQIDKYNEKDHSEDACFFLSLVVQEKNKKLFEKGGIKRIFDKISSIDSLLGKPKVIFIETCRGVEGEDKNLSIVDDIFSVNLNDSLIVYSCLKTKSTNTKEVHSSTFIENLAKELKQNHSETEIHKILTKVNKTMTKEKNKAGVLKQFISYRSCLTKELYLM